MNIKLIVQRIEGKEHIKIERFNTTRNQNKLSNTSKGNLFIYTLQARLIIDNIDVKRKS